MISKTDRQKSIMKILMEAFDNQEEVCVRDIHERLNKEIVYGSVRSALRVLIGHGMIYYTRKGRENYYKPTTKGYAWFRTGV